MINKVRDFIRNLFFRPLRDIPPGYFPEYGPQMVRSNHEALTLPAFFAAVRWYQTRLGVLPMVTYRHLGDGGRERARDHWAYNLLHDQPNPAMTRAVFLQLLAKRVLLDGNFFAVLRWSGIGPGKQLVGIYPLPPTSQVQEIMLDDDWNKGYVVRDYEGNVELVPDSEMMHVYLYSDDGILGRPLLDYACQNLGLHKQVQESASNYYKNSIRPSIVVTTTGGTRGDSLAAMQEEFERKYMGTSAAGRAAFVKDATVAPWPSTTAVDADMINALSASPDNISQWTSLSPLQLGKLDRGTYSNLAADNVSSYQRSLFPLVDLVELEINRKVFNHGDVYVEFLTEAVLRGDPMTNAEVDEIYLRNMVYTVDEVRARLNLAPLGQNASISSINTPPQQQQANGSNAPNFGQPPQPEGQQP